MTTSKTKSSTKKRKKVKKSKTSIQTPQLAETRKPVDSDNLLLSTQYNPASLYYGLMLSAIFSPGLIGTIISFIGGYMLIGKMSLMGILMILIAPVVWIFLECLRNRYTLLDDVSPSRISSSSVEFKQSTNESTESIFKSIPFPTTSIKSKNIPNPSITQRIWLSAEDFVQLHQLLPWSCAKVDIESAEWLNQIISSVWKQMQADFNSQLDQMFGPKRFLDSWFGDGNRFAKLRLTRASLGSEPPRVNGIRVMRRGVRREEVVMDMELQLDNNVQIQVAGAFDIRAGIRGIFFRCKIRVVASPLFREWPAVGTVMVQLLQAPQLHVQTTGCLRLINFFPWTNLVRNFLFAWFGCPNHFKINVARFIPLRARHLIKPLLLFKVDLLEAINLPVSRRPHALCFLDPLSSSIIGGTGLLAELIFTDQRKRTRLQRSRPHPDWTQSFVFISDRLPSAEETIGESGSLLLVRVLLLTGRQQTRTFQIAHCQLPLYWFYQIDSELNGREFDAPLFTSAVSSANQSDHRADSNAGMSKFLSKNGTRHRPLQEGPGASRIVLRLSCLPLCTDQNWLQANSVEKLGKANLPVAVLSILVDSASGLETVARQVQTPELRPLVRISVGNQQQVTSVQERTGNPVWEQTLQFLLYNPKLEDISIEVVDMYYVLEKSFFSQLLDDPLTGDIQHDWVRLSHDGTAIGFFSLPVVDILNAHQMLREGTFQLEGHVEDAYITLTMAIRVTKCYDQVLNNASQPRISLPDYVPVLPMHST